MAMLTKAICKCNTIPIQIPITFFTERENHKIHMEIQKATNTQSNLQQREQCWSYVRPDCKHYYRATLRKIAWYWHKNRHID
jgi:hypothetical protein